MLDLDHRWDTKRFAFYGALLGMVVGVIHNYFDAFWGQVSDATQTTDFLPEIVILMLAGAALLAAVSAIRNWVLRQPYV